LRRQQQPRRALLSLTLRRYRYQSWNLAEFFNDFSRARACACAQGGVRSESVRSSPLSVLSPSSCRLCGGPETSDAIAPPRQMLAWR
jgi:hypothetical protein